MLRGAPRREITEEEYTRFLALRTAENAQLRTGRDAPIEKIAGQHRYSSFEKPVLEKIQ